MQCAVQLQQCEIDKSEIIEAIQPSSELREAIVRLTQAKDQESFPRALEDMQDMINVHMVPCRHLKTGECPNQRKCAYDHSVYAREKLGKPKPMEEPFCVNCQVQVAGEFCPFCFARPVQPVNPVQPVQPLHPVQHAQPLQHVQPPPSHPEDLQKQRIGLVGKVMTYLEVLGLMSLMLGVFLYKQVESRIWSHKA